MNEQSIGKKYKVYAKRPDDTYWSVWSDSDDINKVAEMVNKIEELGYQSKVIDGKDTIVPTKIITAIFDDIERKIADDLEDAYRSKTEHTSKYSAGYSSEIVQWLKGKIDVLTDLEQFIARLKKKYEVK